MQKQSEAPLNDTLVLDLTNVLAGPFCCHQLAQFGARVIKVETPGTGDLARKLGADAALNEAGMGVSFLAQNAGKESITLNLKHPEGKALLKRLVARADVLVENFRPGVMHRLALDWPVLSAVNPALVYCAISGFGQTGPWVDRPAYDQIIQGVSGLMSVTGQPDGDPLRVGYPVADTAGGLTAAMAVCAALLPARLNGQGRFIDVSMLESTMATMGWAVSNYLMTGQEPGRHGNENTTSAPSGTFRAADTEINIAANKDEQFAALAKLIGRPDLLLDPMYATRELRKQNRGALRLEINLALSEHSAQHWCELLNQHGVPAGPVLTVAQALACEQVRSRGLVKSFTEVKGVGRSVNAVTSGVKFDGQSTQAKSAPPTLGQHTRDILGEFGVSESEIDRLAKAGVI